MTWEAALPDASAPPPDAVWCWRILPNTVPPSRVSALRGLLPRAEQERSDRFRQPEDRLRFIAAHAGLRLLLGAMLKQRHDEIAVVQGDQGKPRLADAALEFNLSHSGEVVLIALTAGLAVGVDVERQRPLPDRDALARRFFHRAEVAELASLPQAEAEAAFFRCWTRKEAVAKALGVGLGLPLDGFQVSCRADAPVQLLAVAGFEPPAADWSLYDLAAAPGHAAALAAPRQPLTVRCRTLDLSDGRS